MASIDLQRTFGQFTDPQDEDDIDWFRYYSSGGDKRLTWEQLHRRHVVVVLGEAGIGKTCEFRLEAQRLADAGKPSFFLALNQLKSTADWAIELTDDWQRFEAWQQSGEIGYFHLDSVDEARLSTHADLDKALGVVRAVLAPHLARARIAISSRLTDWTEPAVEDAVRTKLLNPINAAVAQAAADLALVKPSPPAEDSDGQDTDSGNAPEAELLVTTLDPLSRDEAVRCARFFKVEDEAAFWEAVDAGDYMHMATSPLDLGRMVRLWNQKGEEGSQLPRTLGTHREMNEANVTARLAEPNANYTRAGKALEPARLRAAAEALAAAAEFGGRAFVGLHDTVAGGGVLNPYDVLKDFRPDEVQYLVNSAIFDEASFSRVRFHRSIREYLAACWVNRLLTNGQALPLVQVLPLFAVESCSQWIVFQGRMATLSWLAAINVQVREWVVRACPVLLMHDGDPQAWDQASVETAFSQLIDNATSTPMVVDFRSFSGEMRAGQAVGGAAVAAVLARPNLPWQAFSLAMRLARTAKLQETAVPVYAIYRDQSQLESHRAAALTVLQEVGLQEHRAQILADIQSSTLMSNTLLGEALPATRWQSLGVDQLALILGRSADEGDTGTGPMASAIKNDMLSDADLSGATLLLSAVLRSLPRAEAGKPFARYPQESAPKRAWLLHVLPDCFKRVLELSRDAQNPPTAVCVQAAQEVYELRDSGYANADDVTALRTLIQHFQALRWEIALALARLGQPALDRGRMGWDKGMLVGFDGDDLPELTRRAQDSALPAETRDVWFSIALEVAIRQPQRLKVLRQLCEATAGENRAEILERLKGWRKGERSRQRWEADDQARRVKQRQDKEAVVACFEPRLGGIADGTDVAGLRDLLRRVFNTKAWGERGELDFRFISPLFTPQIAEAFAVGLKRFWRTYDPADPMDHPNGTLPTDALLALAGVYAYAESGGTFIEVTDDEAARAAGVSVWASSAPPSWFKQLYAAKPGPVVAALNPRVLREARAPHASHGALDLALRAASAARRPLLAHVQHLIVGDEVVNQAMVKKLIPLLVEDGLLSMVEVGSVCRRKLELTPAGVRIQDLSWLRLWADAQPREACDWFNARLPGLGGESQAQVADFAAEMSATHWVKEPRDQEAVDLLLEVCGVVRQHHSSNASSAGAHESFFGPPTSRFLHSAAQGFVRLRGRLGRFGLQKLHDEVALELRSS